MFPILFPVLMIYGVIAVTAFALLGESHLDWPLERIVGAAIIWPIMLIRFLARGIWAALKE